MKEKIFNWLDKLIELDQQKTLVNDDGVIISSCCSLLSGKEIHITNALKLAQICDLPFKIESRGNEFKYKYEISFTYRDYKFFCLENHINLYEFVENDNENEK